MAVTEHGNSWADKLTGNGLKADGDGRRERSLSSCHAAFPKRTTVVQPPLYIGLCESNIVHLRKAPQVHNDTMQAYVRTTSHDGHNALSQDMGP